MKLLLIENKTETTGDNVILKDGASNPLAGLLGGTSPTLTIGPGGILLYVSPVDGVAVAAGSADTIGIETNDDVDYQILVVGENT